MRVVAVIGMGSIASRHRANLKKLFPEATVLSMSASGNNKASSLDNCEIVCVDMAQIIKAQPEMAIVASPASSHIVHAVALVEQGIPVLIEKPISISSSDLNLIYTQLKQKPCPAGVGYCLRYMPSAIKVKELIDSGAIGSINNVVINVGQYLPEWRPGKDYRNTVSANKSLGGGALLELSHEIDYALWLLGNLKVEHAILRSSDELGLSVEDMADLVLSTSDGAVCNLHMDFLQRPASRSAIFYGDKSRIDWDIINNSVTYHDSQGACSIYSEQGWDRNSMYLDMITDFVAMINRMPNRVVSLDEAQATLLLVEQAKEKASWKN